MSDSLDAVARFTCEGCGKQYRWKQTLAARRAACAKCGNIMTAPEFCPSDDHNEDLYALGFPILHRRASIRNTNTTTSRIWAARASQWRRR